MPTEKLSTPVRGLEGLIIEWFFYHQSVSNSHQARTCAFEHVSFNHGVYGSSPSALTK